MDGTVQFYTRINALLRDEMTVLDLGAGRGAFLDQDCKFRRDLQLLKGKVREVIGADIDPIIELNAAVDRSVVLQPTTPLPFDESSIDLIVSDWVLEHVENPKTFADEIRRILKPGGWLCARTNHKWGSTSLGSRLVPKAVHAHTLRTLQPNRNDEDIFSTYYRLNTKRAVARFFRPNEWLHCSYYWVPEPAYHAENELLWRAMCSAFSLLPDFFGGSFLIFLQKLETAEHAGYSCSR
jgi:SAM-dependent methyltransferase